MSISVHISRCHMLIVNSYYIIIPISSTSSRPVLFRFAGYWLRRRSKPKWATWCRTNVGRMGLVTAIFQWIGLRENLQERPIFHRKIYGFQLKISLKPIQSMFDFRFCLFEPSTFFWFIQRGDPKVGCLSRSSKKGTERPAKSWDSWVTNRDCPSAKTKSHWKRG